MSYQISLRISRFQLKIDIVLAIALILGFTFSLYGFHWGWTECWNPDQMAFRNIFYHSLPFEPSNFQKPPFHTYFNYFLSVLPIDFIARILKKLFKVNWDFDVIKLLWSRLLTIFLFLGSITLVFRITKNFFNLQAGRIVTIIFATSAGFIVDAHYLTADIPVLFWMLLAFYFIQNIGSKNQISDYFFAGFFTGIAAATKYNGLGAGIGIVVAHFLFHRILSWKVFINQKLTVGLSAVIVGFVLAHPFSVITFLKFIGDFRYNYLVTPIYDGTAHTANSYLKFFALFIDLIGLPALIIFSIAIVFSVISLFLPETTDSAKKGVLLLLSIFLLYYYKFGDFPRLEVRFVMPIVPFWLMLSGIFWSKINLKKNTVVLFLIVSIVTYNSISSFYVGKRFVEDSRMLAREWVKKNIPHQKSIESSVYTVKWNTIPGVEVKDIRLPFITGRRKLFEQFFKDDAWMLSLVRQREGTEQEEQEELAWYSIDALLQRQPNYVAINSIYYNRFAEGKFGELYPSVNQYFQDLLNQSSPYKIVFDQFPETSPAWLYPRQILWVDNRMTILTKESL